MSVYLLNLAAQTLAKHRSKMAANEQFPGKLPAAEGLTPQLEVIARRVAWWKPPAEALANTDDFLCRVMTYGLRTDVTRSQAWELDQLIRNNLIISGGKGPEIRE